MIGVFPEKGFTPEVFTRGVKISTPTAARVTKVRNSKYFRSALYCQLAKLEIRASRRSFSGMNLIVSRVLFPEPTFDEEESAREKSRGL